MTYTVSITKQGQISIPAPLRKKYGLDKSKKAIVYPTAEGKIVIEPVRDLLSLLGSLKTKKRISPRKIRKEFEKYLAHRHLQ